ncbi:uncharacterized protein LOC130104727 [Rhinichthys klamathensis goyatoka]|uniref:uncharacterized protein LOC130104727 n=1 Tax=Rhinichthys klamathensis goyatoka TaxID=3034132 RepID=UPI0024B588BA|nr:uncharacterized protein LOC130104727 [Rhinichthys klamathensis goyatoka]
MATDLETARVQVLQTLPLPLVVRPPSPPPPALSSIPPPPPPPRVAAAPPTLAVPAPALTREESRRVSVEETPSGEATLAPAPAKRKRKERKVEQPATPTPASAESRLPESWRTALTVEEQEWIGRELFRKDSEGRSKLTTDLKLWWDPPQPRPSYTQPPASPAAFFACRLFLWTPLRLWGVRPTCCNRALTKCGLYRTIRRVLDIDGWYLMATEYLECRRCKRKVAAWSQEVVSQLGEGHRALFPAILTYKLACDRRVIIQLRERTRGNSATQLYKKLCEAHTEAWMRRSIHYLSVMEPFTSRGVVRMCTPPPKPPPVPQYAWLLMVYCHDILSRLEDVKARVTSVFGTVLKMDSTKKVTRKLSGAAAQTAAWATNVGNEHGQVLMSVLTDAEGAGLLPMAAGLMRRYRDAGVEPPQLLYVDRDCCSSHGGSKTADMFRKWDKLVVRLDIWHLMRRFASGVTTESHQLYKPFLQQLSSCIFLWDPEDTARLLNAKKRMLEAQGMTFSSDAGVWRHVSRKNMALHCRRRTRGAAETERLIGDLLETFGGANGRDTMGISLLDQDRIQKIWTEQRRHLHCIQDPPGVELYTETGRVTQGGISLPVYRCARGSTSLESFHLHLNRFIPGESANPWHFQAFLLEGLTRWNADRAASVAQEGRQLLRSYNGPLQHSLDQLSQRVLGTSVVKDYTKPREYTGELIGIEYLYSQTGRVLQDVSLDPDIPDAGGDVPQLVEDDELADGQQEVEDLTLHVPGEFPSPQTDPRSGRPADAPAPEPSSPTGAPEPAPHSPGRSSPEPQQAAEDYRGPDDQPGYLAVVQLATALVGLRHEPALSEGRVDELIRLYEALSPYDRARVVYPPRYRDRPAQGRFMAAKPR